MRNDHNSLDLARILSKLSRNKEAVALLQQLKTSIAGLDEPDENECLLSNLADAVLRDEAERTK